MSKLTSLIDYETTPEQKQWGQVLFARGAVAWVRKAGNVITAAVEDGFRRVVEVGLDHNEVEAFYCNCDHFAEHDEPCAHLWAALLAAESQYPQLAQGLSRKEPDWKKQLGLLSTVSLQGINDYDSDGRTKPIRGELYYVLDREKSVSEGLPAIAFSVRERKSNGELGKVKERSADSLVAAALEDPQDRLLVAMIQGAGKEVFDYWHGGNPIALPPGMWAVAFPAMAATNRLYWRLRPGDLNLHKLAWDGGEPWKFWLTARLDAAQGQYELNGELRRGEQRVAIGEVEMLLHSGLMLLNSVLYSLDAGGGERWIELFRKMPLIAVPMKDGAELLRQILASPDLPPLDFPEELRVEQVRMAPKPHLRIRPAKANEWPSDKLRAKLSFNYEGHLVEHNSSGVIYEPEKRRVIQPDRAAEQSMATRLNELGAKLEKYAYNRKPDFLLAPKKLPNLVRQLVREGWDVEADGKLYRQPGQIDIKVSSGIDWFDLEGKVDFGGMSVGLPKLLEALRKGENSVMLDDGTIGMLPEDWLAKYGAIAGLGKAAGDNIRFTKSQAGFLDALLASQPRATWDEGFTRTREALRTFAGIAPADPPRTFTGELRPYQREGVGWFDFLRQFGFGGCLADDMGLGKTVQVLALLDARRAQMNGSHRPSLVVVPRSLVFNWKQEAARFAPNLKVLDNTGLVRKKTDEELRGHDLVLTTYGTLRNDVGALRDIPFDYVILDEAQAIKNASSESAKAARLLQGRHRLALSGTPVQNHLGELWSLFDFLNPGLLGSSTIFTGAAMKAPPQETRQVLSHALRPFILRRTKDQVARDLPSRLEQTIYCELDAQQRKLYDELKEHYRRSLLATVATQGINKAKIQILEALLRLRQAAIHPGLIDKARAGEPSAKLDMLLHKLEEVVEEGHKALVFSQFTSMLAIVKKRLGGMKIKYEYLDGQTKDRDARVRAFQDDPGCKLFLISLKAGGLGLNLVAADYVFLLDPWWNPAVEAQAIDRAHRIGQTRQVYACRIIAKDTVEEKVLALQQSKRDLADAIITADNSLIRTLGKEDLELLLS